MPTQCIKDREWCKGLTAISGVLMLIIAVLSILVTAQAQRIGRMEAKSDTIVELRTDMRYVKNDISEIKLMLRAERQ